MFCKKMNDIMAKTCIFYGSETGTTADIARRIAKELGVSDADIHDVADTAPDRLGDYDLLILGSSTWGAGEVAGGWYDFLAGASALDLTRKQIALFGCGDESMCDTFCNAVGEIYAFVVVYLGCTGVEVLTLCCYSYSGFASGPF